MAISLQHQNYRYLNSTTRTLLSNSNTYLDFIVELKQAIPKQKSKRASKNIHKQLVLNVFKHYLFTYHLVIYVCHKAC